MTGRTGPRRNPSIQAITGLKGGREYRDCSTDVTAKFNAGRTAVVIVRVKIARGSRVSRVRLPKRAPARMTSRRMFLTFLQRLERRVVRALAERKRIHSSRVPRGHSQAHHTRPKITVSPTVIRASPSRGIHSRAATIAPTADRGSKRKKRSASGKATRRCRAAKSR
jgi:hypothetical protein